MKFEQVCRVCLKSGDTKSVFTTNCLSHVQMSCAQALTKICSISIDENDGLPQYICKKCLSKLKSAYKFRILCENSHEKLIAERLNNKTELSKREDPKDESEFCDDNESSLTRYDFSLTTSNSLPYSQSDRKNVENSQQHNSFVDADTNGKLTRVKFKKKRSKKLTKESIVKNVTNKTCQTCNMQFTDNIELKTHKLLHSKDKRLQCEICAKVFLRASTLRTHLLTHQNELPFRCTHPDCNKAFPLNSRLQLHMRVHTNERNFICQYCSHAARDKQQLTIHIRYFHTKEKNFLCGDCGKAFVSPQARYYHTKRHQNIRNHHCPHCDKSFVFAFGLQEHLVTHTGEKRFACSLCSARFSRKAHKEKHESRLHGVNKLTTKKSSSSFLSPTVVISNS